MRKMFDGVSILEMDPAFPLPDYRMLESQILLQATVSSSNFSPNAHLVLNILVGKDALEFCVQDRDDVEERNISSIDLNDVPEWDHYKAASFHVVRGKAPGVVESFLRRAFAQPHDEEWTSIAMRMGDRIGVRVGNELGLLLGDTPHTEESKKLYTELAHVALGYDNSMRAAYLASELTQQYRLR